MGVFIAFSLIAAYSVASGYWSRPAVSPAVARRSRYEGHIAAEANGV